MRSRLILTIVTSLLCQWSLVGCAPKPAPIQRMVETTEGRPNWTQSIWIVDVPREFVVDLLGEDAVRACEVAQESGLGACNTSPQNGTHVQMHPNGTASLLVFPYQFAPYLLFNHWTFSNSSKEVPFELPDRAIPHVSPPPDPR
jgi:hypothetical protein